MRESARVIRAAGVDLPNTRATVRSADLTGAGVKKVDHALGMLGVLAVAGEVVSAEMLQVAVTARFDGAALESARKVLDVVLAAHPLDP